MTEKFESFVALHIAGDPVILFNVWDAGSAVVAEKAGAKAIATGSASVATAHGVDDAEGLTIDLAIANAARVVASTSLPVSIDFEGAYAVHPERAASNVARLAATGAIGCNFEDQVVGAEPRTMHATEAQAARIAAIRWETGPAFFINARTDIFLIASPDTHDGAMVDAAIARGLAYAEAGASGFFVPGLADLRLLERVCKAVPLPVNFMAFPGAPSAKDVATTGVARISHGPFPHMLALKAFEEAARAAFAE
ncbi:isocitrate lyase/phosphoenolpyruvate mutase family protein [Sphingomonas sp. JC676]|uniref:isocitrate lyase/PEP mutase family protein n=1 Tax=Sphingomonas sp. JC676 TaxID=2768065 RepID=UPI0016581ACF|nr:isocitrate lyase/phosphoenolpyruvate mutase family protein [Sphingomonas sp. JC676]MBC9033207.1 isocitrate lyase/phosphoenolpyruvate mutase family protein [Sphingomonas sp. JC676]